MASNYTEHYGLCQWEATDQVRREEFNDGNRKVDEALKGMEEQIGKKADQATLNEVRALATKSRFTKLKEINVTEYLTSFEIDLSDVDWTQWDKVHVDYMAHNMPQANLYVNIIDGIFLFQMSTAFNRANTYAPRITLFPGFQANRFVSLQTTIGQMIFPTGLIYTELHKIVFKGGMPQPGNRFIIWGEI